MKLRGRRLIATNSRRRHSAIGNISPMRFEAAHAAKTAEDALARAPRFRGNSGLMEPLRGFPRPPSRMTESRKLSTEAGQLQCRPIS